MSSVTAGINGDEVIFSIHAGKPWGEQDADWTVTVGLDDFLRLDPLPMKGHNYSRAQRIWIPGAEKWVVFIHESHQERSAGPNKEDVYGLYLPPKQYGRPAAILNGADDTKVYSEDFSPYA